MKLTSHIKPQTTLLSKYLLQSRNFHSTPLQNRIFSPIRSEEEITTLLNVSTTQNLPLITFWSASWCKTCQIIKPTLQRLVDERSQNSLPNSQNKSPSLFTGFVEIQIDAPTAAILSSRYMIASVPTIMAFHRGFVLGDRLVDATKATNERFLIEWLDNIAKEANSGGGGSTGSTGWKWFS